MNFLINLTLYFFINFILTFTQEYVDFINELITYDNIIFCDYRSTVPKKIATQVCEFGNTYYSSLEPIRYDRYEKKHFFVAR